MDDLISISTLTKVPIAMGVPLRTAVPLCPAFQATSGLDQVSDLT